VVGADGLVSIGNGRLFPDKQGTVIFQPIKIIAGVFDVDLQVFRRIIVAEPDGFIPVVGDVKLAVVGL
jgi:hypothetical protein